MVMRIDEGHMQSWFDNMMWQLEVELGMRSVTPAAYISPEDAEALQYGQGVANVLSQDIPDANDKRARHHINPDYSNGLPRRR